MAQADAMRRNAEVRREIERLRTEANAARTEADAEVERLRTEAEAARKVHWPQWLIPLATAVLSAVIAIGSVYLGAWSTADEQHRKESRESRAKVYSDYLAATRKYAPARDSLGDAVDERNRLLEPQGINIPGGCTASTEECRQLSIARKSEEKAAAALATVEAAWRSQVDLLADIAAYEAGHVDWRAYSKAEESFQEVFCHEVSAEPREGCKH